MYAIIESGGKQHKVTAGDRLKLERLNRESGTEVEWTPLLVVDGHDFWTSKDAGVFKVVGKVLGDGRRRKVLVFHKKRRKHYKKIYGHRQPFTQVEILSISRA
jgi:large subunit ribosomal protein L21